MVYPYNNDLGSKPPEPKPYADYAEFASVFEAEMANVQSKFKDSMLQKWTTPWNSPQEKQDLYNKLYGKKPEPKQYGNTIQMLDELIKDTYLKPQPFPEPIKKIQPDIPVYSQQAHALRLELKVGGFGIGEHKIGAQWMIADHHTHHHGGLPVDQAEHLIDTMLADIKKNLMNQIKEKAK